MPRRKPRRPNWPYRLALLGILLGIVLYVGGQTVRGVYASGGHFNHSSDWWLAFIAACLDGLFASWFVAIGASIGSFLNVVAFRLPLGRHVGGHSGCFYCQTAIESRDNVPVLAWLRLRGRCRTCRLPISVQYPLVELGLAIVFLTVYLTEFARQGGNLPGVQDGRWGGILRISIGSPLVLRVTSHLFLLSGLVAAALIAVRRQVVPLKLYFWLLVPWCIAVFAQPELIVVPWREAALTGMTARLDALATVLCGLVAAMTVGRIVLPLLFPQADVRLMAGDLETGQARHFLGAMAVAGSALGWQSVGTFAWLTMLCRLALGVVLRRYRHQTALGDPTVWIWLGLLLFRANWENFSRLQILPQAWPEVMRHVAGALTLALVSFSATKRVLGETDREGESEVDSEKVDDDVDS